MDPSKDQPTYTGQYLVPGAHIRVKAFPPSLDPPEIIEGFVRAQDGAFVYFTESEDGTGEVLTSALFQVTVLSMDAWTDGAWKVAT